MHQSFLTTGDIEARRVCQARARELARRLRDPAERASGKEEARTELQEISAYLTKDSRQLRDKSKAAAEGLRSAITRLLRRLLVGNWPRRRVS